jgi:hypothetical protein
LTRIKYIKILAHPVFIAGLISLVLLPFFVLHFHKYRIQITGIGVVEPRESFVFWEDLNNDKESERLGWFLNTEGKATLRIADHYGFIKDLLLFNGEALIMRNPPLISDLDNDHFPEMNVFYHRNDSLFLKRLSYSSEFIRSDSEEIFVDVVTNYKGKKDYNASGSIMGDLDHDAVDELIFLVNAGYPVIPRSIYSFNSVNDKLQKSGFLGAHSNVNAVIDTDGDGNKEILLGQYAPGNMHGPDIEGKNDRSVRLLVLDNRLRPETDMLVSTGDFTSVGTIILQKGDQKYIGAICGNKSNPQENFSILLFTADGKLLKKIKTKNPFKSKSMSFFDLQNKDNEFSTMDEKGCLTTYNLQLQPIRSNQYPWKDFFPFDLDMDRDGKDEHIVYNTLDHSLNFYRTGLTDPAIIKMPDSFYPRNAPCLKINRNKPNEIFFQTGEDYYLVSYAPNPFYTYRFLFWLLGFGITAGIIHLLQYLQRLVLREKYLTERRVSELQMLLVRNQLSPHFLINAINSISYHLMEKNPEEANNSIIRLSRLIRNNLVAAEQFSRPLNEELEATSAYLEIVLSQCDEPFSVITEIAPGTNMDIEVPVMVIQNYAENAVKHGVRSLGANGKIELHISQDNKYLHILISDNGIGRKKASEMSDKPASTGKGTGLMQQFFDEVNKYNENKISVAIHDLYDEQGVPSGTRVDVEIPVTMKYRIYEK